MTPVTSQLSASSLQKALPVAHKARRATGRKCFMNCNSQNRQPGCDLHVKLHAIHNRRHHGSVVAQHRILHSSSPDVSLALKVQTSSIIRKYNPFWISAANVSDPVCCTQYHAFAAHLSCVYYPKAYIWCSAYSFIACCGRT